MLAALALPWHCSHYVYLKRPSELGTNVNIYMFREKLFPSWESYPNGGCWIVKLNKAVGVTSKLWQDLVRAPLPLPHQCIPI